MTSSIDEAALYIGGRWVAASGERAAVIDPATEKVTGTVVAASTDDVDNAVQEAAAAFPRWAATSVADRLALLDDLRRELSARAELLAAVVQREQGSPPALARKLHVDVPIAVVAATRDALAEFVFRTEIGNSLVVREPVGVVAAITPWNLPLHQVIAKVVPAIASGATVVLKPAALTPLTAFELARVFDEIGLPSGVFNLVVGNGSTVGDHLARHSMVDQVSFTGSTEVGRTVAATAAQTIKRVTLELGGKSASVVVGDVDGELLERAVKVTIANCFLNGGQTCTALSRLVVPADRIGEVQEIAVQAVQRYTFGDRLGPLISAQQRDHVLRYVVPGAAGEASLARSEQPLPERGYYASPTVLIDADPASPAARDEIFGPVLTVLAARTDDEAIALANDSIYGLGGAVWAPTTARALDVAEQMRTGQVDINGAAFNPRAPFGGYRQSGLGRELGDFGIADTLEIKAIQR